MIAYLPLATTLVAAIFFAALVRRFRTRGRPPHLAWWAAGVLCFGIGTALESAITLFGNTMWLTKAWYVAGALLGAYPLAQGSVHFLLSKKVARITTRITVPFALFLIACVLLSPTRPELLDAKSPSGAILSWTWIRWLTPLLNVYALIFLAGGAALSFVRDARRGDAPHRALGNATITVGAILPGIGGSLAKSGNVDALYVTELVGLALIWMGYLLCVREFPRVLSAQAAERTSPS